VPRTPADDEELATLLDATAGIVTVSPSFTVTVTAGPDRDASISLDEATPGRIFVGTSPACALRLTDPKVSRRHLALEVDATSLRLIDLGSTNGTRVSDLVVRDASLSGGERIALGDSALLVGRGPGAAPPSGRHESFGAVVGKSDAMCRLYPLCHKLAAAEIPLLIEGETGTGKEVLAEAIHAASARAAGPFVVCDCTAIAPNLAEAALFGHERGAFTGATGSQRGFFEQADDGTLLLDEIGDLDLGLQAKLLRAIERREIRRVGGDRWIRVDVRVIAATRRNLDREIEAGRFRDDLFYRLAIARVELPPLRKRRGDVAVLARHFWSRLGGGASGLPADLERRLDTHEWPGNVRELRNTIARHVALGDLAMDGALGARGPRTSGTEFSAEGDAEDFTARVLSLELPLVTSRDMVVEAFERRYIARLLDKYSGDATRAAASAGVARRYFQLLRAKRSRTED
jgi:DNA-binding NtrC family response regulator